MRKVSPATARAVESALDSPIPLPQFISVIRGLPANRAPGPPGLTANMIKAWPVETIIAVHDILTRLWNDKYIPTWWGDKLLCGIPKKPGEPALTNIRPIGILEILREMWTSIIVTRIQSVWEEHNVLHPSQCGYR